MAKALGGAGDKGKTNPEELFAAGYVCLVLLVSSPELFC
jgi:organic hydroperoxide reductase OsmC/OhrA